jgi:hypothetical protein
MQTPINSTYEVTRNQQRTAARRQRRLVRLVKNFRALVERAISLARAAAPIEQQITAYDQDIDGFPARAAADRSAWWAFLIFVAAVILYVVGEFFVAADVAEWLAHPMAPLFVDGQGNAETPVWLRRVVGVFFVGLMLGVTLVLKYVTTYRTHRLLERRAQVIADDAVSYRSLTMGIWLNHGARIGYMAAVAGLYIWLFGFAQERAAIMASLAAEQKTMETLDLGFKIEGGEVQSTGPTSTPTGAAAESRAAGHKLAYASAVIYVCLWLLHGLVLLLPTEGFGRELPLAHFGRAAAGRQVEALRATEERTLRDILERINRAEGEEREILIREAQPVRKRLIEIAGGNPEESNAGAPPTAPYSASNDATFPQRPDGDAAGFVPPAEHNGPFTPRSTSAAGEPTDDVYSTIFGPRN